MISNNKKVFINCPFDSSYELLLHATIFTVYYCGFEPRCALEVSDDTTNRIDKICSLIKSCSYGIHDISRIEINENKLPRFNMPLELGIFLGAKKYGDTQQKKKKAIIFEKHAYLYQQYISDIAGIDPKAHKDDYKLLIKFLRSWFFTNSVTQDQEFVHPGIDFLIKDFEEFYFDKFPKLLKELHHRQDAIDYTEYCKYAKATVQALKTIYAQ